MGKIKVTPCEIEGLYVIEPTVFKDERGYFVETYNQNDFKEAGLNMVFVQDNQSMSVKGVLRGLHYQKHFPQGKLVRAIRGTVLYVEVDLRRALPMDLVCYPMRQNLLTNVRISIIRAMRAVLHGTTLRSVWNGRSRRV